MYSLYLLHWNLEEAKPLAGELTNVGYRVEYGPLDNKSLKEMRNDPPDLMLIDLSRNPSTGRDVAVYMRSHRDTRYVPIVFLGGDPVKVEKIRDMFPDAVYTDPDHLNAALKAALENPPPEPVVPKSAMAAYADTPLPKKLGIKPGTTVNLISAPPNFTDTLVELPPDVTIQHDSRQQADVVLWFVRSMSELTDQIEQVCKHHATAKLWICWRKQASGVSTDVNSNDLRQAGIAAGLVDYKISSIDKTWSGLLFAQRKEGK